MEDNCLFCTGGKVEAFIGTESHTWDCPDCNGTGTVSTTKLSSQENSSNAMNTEINKSNCGV